MGRFLPAIFGMLLLVGATTPVEQRLPASNLGSAAYILPITGPYAIHRRDLQFEETGHGIHQLVEVRGQFSYLYVVPEVRSYAVVGQHIVGQTRSGYYVFNTGSSNPTPQVYPTAEQWRAALAAIGVAGDIPLLNPDVVAATKPDPIIHPWHYRAMHNRLGHSDEEWSGILLLSGLACSLLMGFVIRCRPVFVVVVIVLGLVVNVVAEIVIGEGGGPACVGFVGFPLIYLAAAYVGHLGRRMLKWIRQFVPAKTATLESEVRQEINLGICPSREPQQPRRYSKRRWIMVAVIAVPMVAGAAAIWMMARALSAQMNPVTDPAQYPAILSNERATGNPYLGHFPPTIPATARNVQFLHQPRILQGAFQFHLRCALPPAEIQAIMQRYGPQATTAPSQTGYPLFDPLPLSFQVILLGSKEIDGGNHGHSYGVAIDPTAHEVMYWAEEW